MVKDLFIDFHSKEFDFNKQIVDVRNNIIVKKSDYNFSAVLYGFMEGLLKPHQKLFAVVFCLKGDKQVFSGKHFIREIVDVSYFEGFYIVTWKQEVKNV